MQGRKMKISKLTLSTFVLDNPNLHTVTAAKFLGVSEKAVALAKLRAGVAYRPCHFGLGATFVTKRECGKYRVRRPSQRIDETINEYSQALSFAESVIFNNWQIKEEENESTNTQN